MKIKSKILIIAGSDSSGGAGIQADIKTVTSLGCYAMTAITAITSQNTTGVLSILPVSAKNISQQIEFTSKDIKPDAIKIGMLHSTPVIRSVINSLKKISINKIILDPVMVAKGGAKLIDSKSIKILRSELIKKVSLITPNIPEAEVLTKTKIKNLDDMIAAVQKTKKAKSDIQKKPPKIGPTPFKINQKCFPKFDLKCDIMFDRFLIDFDLQNVTQKRGNFPLLTFLERTLSADPLHMTPRSHFGCFLLDC